MNSTDWSEEVVRDQGLDRTDWYWKHGRWKDEAFHPVWKDRKPPLAVIHKRPRAKRRPGAPNRPLPEQLKLIILKVRAREYELQGQSERRAIHSAFLDMHWNPATAKELARVRRELWRM